MILNFTFSLFFTQKNILFLFIYETQLIYLFHLLYVESNTLEMFYLKNVFMFHTTHFVLFYCGFSNRGKKIVKKQQHCFLHITNSIAFNMKLFLNNIRKHLPFHFKHLLRIS